MVVQFKVVLWGVVSLATLVPTTHIASKYHTYAIVRERENKIYAERVFERVVAFDQVLASKQWMAFTLEQLSPAYELGRMGGGGGEMFCQFAVVNLTAVALSSPPETSAEQSQLQMRPPFNFTGDWLPTPAPSLEDGESSFGHPCATEVGETVMSRMVAALAFEGSWWHGDAAAVNGVLYVYSKPQNLAVRLYYGD
jgi:hypothetical protein